MVFPIGFTGYVWHLLQTPGPVVGTMLTEVGGVPGTLSQVSLGIGIGSVV